MMIAVATPTRTGNPGVVPPWLQGPRPVTPQPVEGPAPAPTMRRGSGAVEGARRGVNVQAEQRRIDEAVQQIRSAYAALGIQDSEGNGPVQAYFRPYLPNAAYAPDGDPKYRLPPDSIGVGIDPRSGRSFAEAPDVIAHELAHRIIDHMTTGQLSMHPLSQDIAVHESLADTFAALIDRDDWTIGEQLVEPVRMMDHPERLGHPGHVKDLETILRPGSKYMVPVGRDRRTGKIVKGPDWHVVAGIPNKAAALIGEALGRDKLGEIYIKAVREGVRPGRSIGGLAVAVLNSAKDLYGTDSHEFQVTRDAWDAVGVLDLLRQQASTR